MSSISHVSQANPIVIPIIALILQDFLQGSSNKSMSLVRPYHCREKHKKGHRQFLLNTLKTPDGIISLSLNQEIGLMDFHKSTLPADIEYSLLSMQANCIPISLHKDGSQFIIRKRPLTQIRKFKNQKPRQNWNESYLLCTISQKNEKMILIFNFSPQFLLSITIDYKQFRLLLDMQYHLTQKHKNTAVQ